MLIEMDRFEYIGKRFHSLIITSATFRLDGVNWVEVLCDCGAKKNLRLNNVIALNTMSCGCARKIRNALFPNITHGHSSKGKVTTEYNSWRAMIKRCESVNHKSYHRYGGKGISVCKRWRLSFQDFLADMGSKPSSEHSLDRINNDGNYEPKNCRWASRAEQNCNKSHSKNFEFEGRILPLNEIVAACGIRRGTYDKRIERGWSHLDALYKPLTKYGDDFDRKESK
jgi:hypothetical protein